MAEKWIAVQREWGYPDYEGGPVVRLWDVQTADGMPITAGSIHPENKAIAHLIAAAPAMYEALEKLLDFFAEDEEPEVTAGLNALALARGEVRVPRATEGVEDDIGGGLQGA